MTDKIVKLLPFWETVGRSFKYVLKNKKLLIALLPVLAVLVVWQIAFGLPFMCSYSESFCLQNWQHTISTVFLMLVVVGIIINYCRSIICKETVDFISLKFFKRMLLYILWSVFLTFLVSIPLALIISILLAFGVDTNIVLIVSLFSFFALGTFFAPLIIALPALSVDDYKFTKISKLFQLVKGNKMSIFFGQFVVMIPYLLWVTFAGYLTFAIYLLNK